MTEPDLSESAWVRAKRDSKGIYRSVAFSLAMIVLGLLAAAAAGVETSHRADTETRVLMPVVFGLGALAVGCLAVLTFQFAAAPLRQRNDLRLAFGPMSPADPDLMLRDLRRRGRDLLAELGTPDFSLESSNVESWTAEVISILSAQDDREHVERFLEASDGERGVVSVLESRLAALDEIIEARVGADLT